MAWANGPTPLYIPPHGPFGRGEGDKRDFGGEPGAEGARLAPKSPGDQNQKIKSGRSSSRARECPLLIVNTCDRRFSKQAGRVHGPALPSKDRRI